MSNDDPLEGKKNLPRPTEEQQAFMLAWLEHWHTVFDRYVTAMENIEDPLPAAAWAQYSYFDKCRKCVRYLHTILAQQRPEGVKKRKDYFTKDKPTPSK